MINKQRYVSGMMLSEAIKVWDIKPTNHTMDSLEQKYNGFGWEKKQWEIMKSCYREGDEIFSFSSPREWWNSLCGRGGYCLVRWEGEEQKILVDWLTCVS